MSAKIQQPLSNFNSHPKLAAAVEQAAKISGLDVRLIPSTDVQDKDWYGHEALDSVVAFQDGDMTPFWNEFDKLFDIKTEYGH